MHPQTQFGDEGIITIKNINKPPEPNITPLVGLI